MTFELDDILSVRFDTELRSLNDNTAWAIY